jgi:CheY-like chemotaxis protein
MFSILLVDDDVQILSAFKRTVAGLPVRLRIAGSASEAFRELEAELPDVLISDCHLGDGDGVALIEAIRSRKGPGPRCVLYTSAPPARFPYGFDVPVLLKPCEPEVLRSFISALVRDAG